MSDWIPSDHFPKDIVYTQQDFAWDKLNNPDLRGTRLLKISKNASEVARVYQLNSWIIERLDHEKEKVFDDLESWLSSLKSTNRQCLFRTKKSTIEALHGNLYWFDSLKFLDETQAAQGTGELLKLRYWSGSRKGQERYISVVNVTKSTIQHEMGAGLITFGKLKFLKEILARTELIT